MTDPRPTLILKPTQHNVACELTASDRGAISVIGICGLDLTTRLQQFFKAANSRALSDQKHDKPIYGLWNQEDVILCFQGVDYAEVHCHGSVFARSRIMEDLQSLGFNVQNWKELSCDNETTSMQAVRELPNCTTVKTAAIMTWQSEGALDHAIEQIESLFDAGNREQATREIQLLLSFADVGLHLTRPWNVALVGAPNAGKSSLINRIVGFDRSIVFDQPGTTRDRVTVDTAIDGWPIQLIDTAGIRTAKDSIEQAGVALARQAIADSDLILEVVDASKPQKNLLADNSGKRIVVFNKCDLVLDHRDSQVGHDSVTVSALTGQGTDRLLQLISTTLVPNSPETNQAVPFRNEHLTRLECLRTKSLK